MTPMTAEREGHCECPLCTIRRWAQRAFEEGADIELVIGTALSVIGEVYGADITASMQEGPQETVH